MTRNRLLLVSSICLYARLSSAQVSVSLERIGTPAPGNTVVYKTTVGGSSSGQPVSGMLFPPSGSSGIQSGSKRLSPADEVVSTLCSRGSDIVSCAFSSVSTPRTMWTEVTLPASGGGPYVAVAGAGSLASEPNLSDNVQVLSDASQGSAVRITGLSRPCAGFGGGLNLTLTGTFPAGTTFWLHGSQFSPGNVLTVSSTTASLCVPPTTPVPNTATFGALEARAADGSVAARLFALAPRGDANTSGYLDGGDIASVNAYLNGLLPLMATVCNGDANSSGFIEAVDMFRINAALDGLVIQELPACTVGRAALADLQDGVGALRIGHASAVGDHQIEVPLHVSLGVPATATGTDRDGIAGVSFRLTFPSSSVSSARVSRVGACSQLDPAFEQTLTGPGWVSHVVLPKTTGPTVLAGKGEDVECFRVSLDLTESASPPFKVAFDRDHDVNVVANRDASRIRTFRNGSIRFVDGTVSVR